MLTGVSGHDFSRAEIVAKSVRALAPESYIPPFRSNNHSFSAATLAPVMTRPSRPSDPSSAAGKPRTFFLTSRTARIVRIMTRHVGLKMSLGRKLLLGAAGLLAVAAPVAFGVLHATQTRAQSQVEDSTNKLPAFEVVSIRPDQSGAGFTTIGAVGVHAPRDRFIATNITIKALILWAWAPGNSRPLPDDQVTGGPSWINSDKYDIDAKLEDSQVAALEKLAPLDRLVQTRLMVRSLLADRFKLVMNHTTLIVPVFALVVARGGPKLQETAPCSTPAPGTFPMPPPPPPSPGASPAAPQGPATPLRAGSLLFRPGETMACAEPVSELVRWLRLELGRPVVDQTGLTGNYSFDLKWTPDVNSPGAMPGPSPGAETPPPDASGPSIFTAIQEQLGLKLESTKGPEEAITIAHIEKPSPN
ncbi:hypothetical protein SBA5_890006 [Candidatus Sulfotelmatomonas gaucii]|uniref:TIGR03435 family protein n=1 Tax=Candidatus Sulfuritelmatomonas gaucii TaxID=2043161 RepID=A0A2N9M7V9_9BACT|nr:hypothetical protein SBA5_890006 [Candidatus Sulfotelmatomonas gaucii]